MSAAIFFSDLPSLLKGLATVDTLHLHIAAKDGDHDPIAPGDDYHLQPSRLAMMDTLASILRQAQDKLLKMKVCQLEAMLPETGVVAPYPEKPKKSDLVGAVIAQFTEKDPVALVGQVKARLPKFKYKNGMHSPQQCMLILQSYKIRQPHEDAAHAMQTINRAKGLNNTVVHFDVFRSQPDDWDFHGDTIMTTFLPSCSQHTNRYVYRTQTLEGIKGGTPVAESKQIVVAAVTRLLGLGPEECSPEWPMQVDAMVQDHRRHMDVARTTLPVATPLVPRDQEHMACRGGCGFYGHGEDTLCSKCRVLKCASVISKQ